MEQIIECVANISEGQNQKTIFRIADSIRSCDKTTLLHIDAGKDANRTVYTFVGTMKSLRESVLNMYNEALTLIDMRKQTGTHPRIGAVDVCPFIPIKGITINQLIPWVESLAKEISENFNIPIYLYEDSAKHDYRRNLATIRKGQYEGLKQKFSDSRWQPDFAKFDNWEKSGASIIGVRQFLLAYNINLQTRDIKIAKDIAKQIRGSGYIKSGKRISGLFPSVKAIGWYIDEYDCTQVSMNLTNFHNCSFHQVYQACSNLALTHNTKVTGSELIGLTPLQALLTSGLFYGNDTMDDHELMLSACHNLGLSSVKQFNPNEQILEYVLNNSGNI